MRIALVGCGYVADMYMETLAAYRGLELLGVFDRDAARLAAFAGFHKVAAYGSLHELLDDARVQLVVNLTNPSSHHEVSLAALRAGRHVYSEKPLAMSMDEADELVAEARARGLVLAGAPCNHLSEAMRVLRREVASGRLGRVVLALAEMDDGMLPGLDYQSWRSRSGAPWPARDEFEVGCTMEHAGYQVAPLVSLFGPVRRVTAFNANLMPDKGVPVGATETAPDYALGMLEFDGGVVARVTCSILAPRNRSLRIVGADGVLTLTDVWEYDAPVRYSQTGAGFVQKVMRKIELALDRFVPGVFLGRAVAREKGQVRRTGGGHRMDFARGVAQLARQIEDGAPGWMSTELALHVTEVALALQVRGAAGQVQVMRTADALTDWQQGMRGA